MLFFPTPPLVHAAGISVTTLSAADDATDGFCSLREAIYAANTNAPYNECTTGALGLDTITISVTGTIVLTTTLPAIIDPLTINGPDKELLTISGNNAVRVIFMGSGAGKILNLSNVTIANGFVPGDVGGGIYSAGTLNITSTTFYSNSASNGAGGIYNSGTLNITGTTFYSNSAIVGSGGGGILNDATVTIINSTFLTNTTSYEGGGIRNNGTLTVTNTTFSGNNAGDGGGIWNYGTLNITNTTFSGNSAGTGGGILGYQGSLNITNSTFSGNSAAGDGGGIRNGWTITGAIMTLTNSTFSGNTATIGGGGIANTIFSTATITNSTFYSNSATAGSGGGIDTSGRLTMTNSTLSNNNATNLGGGIFRSNDTATLRNTIVANNTAGTGANCYGAVDNGGNNIDSGTSCGWDSTSGSMSDTNPKLAPLGNYGGATKTMPLIVGSPAINGVTYNSPNGAPSTDQRGFPRPIGGGYDIGAFEGFVYPIYLPLIMR